MSHRSFIPTLILIVAIFLLPAPAFPAMVQARTSPQAPAKKAWTPPKTPHGDPDLQGTWSTTTTAPLERPPQFGDRRFLTDEEVAAREKQLERQLEADSQETVSSGSRANTGPPDHWTERASRASRQTSLVVEPPDGRVPVTAAAEARRDYDIAHVTDAFEHMSPWDRCIGRGTCWPSGSCRRRREDSRSSCHCRSCTWRHLSGGVVRPDLALPSGSPF